MEIAWDDMDKSVANTEPSGREISCDLLDGLSASRNCRTQWKVKFRGGVLDGLSARRSSRAQWKRNFVVTSLIGLSASNKLSPNSVYKMDVQLLVRTRAKQASLLGARDTSWTMANRS